MLPENTLLTYSLYPRIRPRKKRTMVHVPDLLGCAFSGPTTDEAVAGAPTGIRKYLEFLQDTGEEVDPGAPIGP